MPSRLQIRAHPVARDLAVSGLRCTQAPARKNYPSKSLKLRAESSPESTQGADSKEKVPFGNTRKDVLIIGVGVTVAGFALKYGLEFGGLEPAQAGNVVQITFVLGLMLAWAGTYIFRVGNKEMTYVKQLKDYEDAVMKKRLEELPEAELEAMLAEVEEEQARLKAKRAAKVKEGSL